MTTAILSALAEEQQGLLELLEQARRVTHAGRDFWTGFLHARPVVLALSRIGKVAAATTTTCLIERFAARRVVFTGVAGGLAPAVRVGDVVVGLSYVQHDMDASPLFPRHEVPLYGRSRFDADAQLAARLVVAARQGLPAVPTPSPAAERAVHQGLIASGDRFVATAAESTALRLALPEALCVEMEGAAVAQVCHDYSVAFAAVRSISDRADDSASGDFQSFVRSVAGPCSTRIVSALLQSHFLPT